MHNIFVSTQKSELGQESISSVVDREMSINEQIAERYGVTDVRIEANSEVLRILENTAEKATQLVRIIDEEVAKLGLVVGEPVDVGSQEFLNFILQHWGAFGIKPDQLDRYRVTNSFDLECNGASGREVPNFERIRNSKVKLCGLFLQEGIDVRELDNTKLEELFGGKANESFAELEKTIRSGRLAIEGILSKEVHSYIGFMKEEFSQAIERAVNTTEVPESMEQVKKVLYFFTHDLNNPERKENLVPEIKALIKAKQQMPPEKARDIDDFLEENEELVLRALGEHYFSSALHKCDDYEITYKWVFGLDEKEVQRRRERNAEGVNSYIETTIRERGQLTVADLVQTHILGTRGILPSFAQGFRSKETGKWSEIDKVRRTAYFGGNVETENSKTLDTALESLVDRANKLAQTNCAQAVFDIGLGGLYAEFISMHPHPDGNGTNAVFFIESVRALRESAYQLPDTYDPHYKRRVFNSLGKNPVALAVAYTQLKAYEATHKVKHNEDE